VPPAIPRRSILAVIEDLLPKIVLAPTTIAAMIFIYGFILWTAWISFTKSRMLPRYDLAGFYQYVKLFTNDRWWVACKNLMIFGGLFIVICIVLGLFLAILLDQRIRAEGALRTIYLYPMALSFIVTGTAWKWILNPGLGMSHAPFDFPAICSFDSFVATAESGGLLPSMAHEMAVFPAVRGAIFDVVTNFCNSSMASDKAAKSLASEVQSAL